MGKSCTIDTFDYSNGKANFTTNCKNRSGTNHKRTTDISKCYTRGLTGNVVKQEIQIHSINMFCPKCEVDKKAGYMDCTCDYNGSKVNSSINLNINLSNNDSYIKCN